MPIETTTIARQGPSGTEWAFIAYHMRDGVKVVPVLKEARAIDMIQFAQELNELRERIHNEFLVDADRGAFCASCKKYIPNKDIIRLLNDPDQLPACDDICADRIREQLRDSAYIATHGMHAFRGVSEGDF